MTTRPHDQAPAEVELSPEAERSARELAAEARRVAAGLPFGSDPAGFLAALERLADEDAEERS